MSNSKLSADNRADDGGDFYKCENCGHMVPLLNASIHPLRCRGSTTHTSTSAAVDLSTNDVHQSHLDQSIDTENFGGCNFSEKSESVVVELNAETQSANSTSDSEFWPCTVCTYRNPSGEEHCQMCGQSNLPIEATAPITTSCTTGCRQQEWACSACTYINTSQHSLCAICGEMRPPDSAFTDRLIDPPTPEEHIEYDTADTSAGMAAPIMLGAGLGAGVAWLSGRSVVDGAFAGAGMGAIGSLLMNEIDPALQFTDTAERDNEFPRGMYLRGGGQFGLPDDLASRQDSYWQNDIHRMMSMVMMMHANSEALGDEGLEDFFRNIQDGGRSTAEETINSLPIHTYTDSHAANADDAVQRNSEKRECSICLEPYTSGDNIKTLPCLHSFHSSCLDQWLRQSRMCPICKHSL